MAVSLYRSFSMKRIYRIVLVIVLRPFLTLVGRRQGFGSCPNCGDSWSWKQPTDRRYNGSQGEAWAPVSVVICVECAKHPSRINFTRVRKNLVRSEWSPDNAD